MTAPQPPHPASPRAVAWCLALAVAVIVAGIVAVAWLATRPITPAAEPASWGPMPAATARPAPHTVDLTEMPMHQRGPQALRTPEESR